MKFGIAFANAGPLAEPHPAVSLARAAEEAGFESIWAVEHVVVPVGYTSTYPYSAGGRMAGGEGVAIPDPLTWLAFVAAYTSRLRLATGMLILPLHDPLVLAKQTATLDVLSGGRLMLGVGAGWLREEFEALGVPFTARGARLDEYVDALRVLWRQAEPTFAGRFVRFERAMSQPKPVQSGGVPVVVGGHTDAAARRAGRLGDGFFPGPTQELPRLLALMRAAAADAGRDPSTIEVTCFGPTDAESVRRQAELGVSRLIIPAPSGPPEVVERVLGRFGQVVISRV